MLNVGLTGNVAAGKSTVTRWFGEWGATVIDADELVREVQAPGSPVVEAIARRFGDVVLGPGGAVDRDALRRRVMGDAAARADLNVIVHPAVRRLRDLRAAEARARGDVVLVNDIPLLFEVLDPEAFDVVVLVDAAPAIRRGRLIAVRGLPPEEADRLIAAQMSSARKRERSHIVLDNDGSLDALRREAWRAWETIRRRAAAHAAGGVPGPLLAVFAHPGDETLLAGGTLARYADAGAAIHLGILGVAPPPLADAARLLGVQTVSAVPRPESGAASPADAGGLEDLLRRTGPAVVLGYGPDGVTGDPARRSAGRLTRAACGAAAPGAVLYTVALPDDAAAARGRRVAATPRDRIAAHLDVRPWRDRKTAAAERLGPTAPGPDARDLSPPDPWLASEREWWADARTHARPSADLLARPDRVDSPPGGG